MKNERIEKAKDFCIKKHIRQKRKYTKQKYAMHPITVAKVLETLRNINNFAVSNDLIVAGFLHDTLEDTDTTEEEIKKEFGENVLDLVKQVTGEGNIRTKDGYVLKLADMISNAYDIPEGVEDDDGLNEYLQKRIFLMNIFLKDAKKDDKSLKELVSFD